MITFEIESLIGVLLKEVYNEWDVVDGRAVDARSATEDDVGKLLRFQDGSGWLSKIVAVTPKAIRTEVCLLMRQDYVMQCKIHPTRAMYSGTHLTHQHKYVLPYTKYEKQEAKKVLRGEPVKKMTERIKMITLEELQTVSEDKQINAKWLVERLIKEAMNEKGTVKERVDVLKILAAINGVSLEDNINKNNSNFFLVGSGTVQQERRLSPPPRANVLKNIIKQAKSAIEEADFQEEQ